MGLLDDLKIGDYLKLERQEKSSFQDRKNLIEIMASKGIGKMPKCRVCKRKPERIAEYKDHDNPSLYVLERESVDKNGLFCCTSCFTRNL